MRISAVLLPLLLLPNLYPENTCVNIARDFQEVNGGNLALFYPVKENGAYNFTRYGHMLNYKIIDGQEYYLDWKEQRIMLPYEYRSWIRYGFYSYDKITEFQYDVMKSTWILPDERPPFGFNWEVSI